jgi:hypothetical protein
MKSQFDNFRQSAAAAYKAKEVADKMRIEDPSITDDEYAELCDPTNYMDFN